MSRVNKLSRILVGACLVLLGNAASAAVIYFDPTPKNALVGDIFTVDLVWDGSGVPDYIGDFDVEIAYDASIVSYTGSEIDPDRGVDSFGCTLGFACDDLSVSPVITIFQVSFDPVFGSPGDLESNQDNLSNMFRLATLNFTALADGISPLTFGRTVFGNENGDAISPTLRNGSICVGANCTPVPEPGSLALFGLGLLALGRRRLR